MDLNILGNLKEKAGPLPEWAWIVGIAGLGYLAYRRHAAKATPSQTNTTATTGNSGIDPLTGLPYNTEGNGYAGAYLTAQYDELNALGLNTSQIGILNSNVGTATTAINGNSSAVGANTNASAANTTALGASTAAVTGNTAATAANTTAVKDIPAPIVAAPVVAAPAPVAPAPAPSPVQRTYTVVPGDNLSAIATRYGTTWQNIYNANKGIIGSNPNLIHPGQKLVIP